MSLIVQTIMRLMGKLGKGERRCASCGRGYRPAPEDRGYCPRCEPARRRYEEKTDDSGRPFRED